MRAIVGAACLAMSILSAAAADANSVGGLIRDVATGARIRSAVVAGGESLHYGGGMVLHANRTHLIFWEPSGTGLRFDSGYEALMERFLAQVAADSRRPTNVYGLSGQYSDPLGPAAYDSRYGGAVVATDPLPRNDCVEPASGPGWTACVTDGVLEREIDHVVRTDHLPTTGADVYFLVTPSGFGSCIDRDSTSCALGGSDTGYCGYHSQTFQGTLYAFIPYNAVAGHCQSGNPRPNASTADPTISTISHEHNEMVTDPEEDAWINSSNQEDGDLCITSFGPTLGGSNSGAWNEVIHGGHYFLQEEWSNEDGSCQPRDEGDPISFSAPSRTVAGKPVAFTAHAIDPDGSIVAYHWFLGDRVTGRRRMIWHVFRRAGVHRIVLRTTDRAGNWAFYARTVRVSTARASRALPASESGRFG